MDCWIDGVLGRHLAPSLQSALSLRRMKPDFGMSSFVPLGKSASHGFAAVRDAVPAIAAVRAAGLVHFRNHADFQQGAWRGERNFVRTLVFQDVIPPLFRRQLLFHVTLCGGNEWKR